MASRVASTTGRALIAKVPVIECKMPTRIGASSGREQEDNVAATTTHASRRRMIGLVGRSIGGREARLIEKCSRGCVVNGIA